MITLKDIIQKIVCLVAGTVTEQSPISVRPTSFSGSKDLSKDTPMLITRNEILMGRDGEFPLSLQLEKNLSQLLVSLNKFREIYGKPMTVSSGYRPGHYNIDAGGAKNSNHTVCMACDFKDSDGSLDKFCLENQHVLESCNLFLESPGSTPGWCHLDIKTRANRVFNP